MLGKKQLWALAAETMQAFAPFYREAMQKAIQDSGAPDNWFFLNLARASDPAPIAVERLGGLIPYTAPKRYIEALEELAGLELLERVGEDAYRLTDLGREAVEDIFKAAHQSLESVEPLPPDEMDQLNGLLYRLVEATLKAPQPQDKESIASSRWTDPGEDTPAAVKADQYLTDLYRFRDDAHLAAWQPYEVNGPAWEALTLIWRDEAHTAEELAERLSRRAYIVEDYEEALQNLAARGWIAEEKGHYKLTAQGAQIREEAEEATDRHFYVGWSVLNEDELAQLESLLTQANERLQATTLERIWGLARELSGAIPAAVREAITSLIEQHGLNERGYFFLLLTTKRLEPDAISIARLGIRDPYTSPAQYENLLAGLAEAGFLKSKGNGAYTFTSKGRAALQDINYAFYTKLGEVSTLPTEDLTRLESLMIKVVQACLKAQKPENKWGISTAHRGHPGQAHAPLARIDQRLDDLNAFRDDVHLAAWQPYEVSGRDWETFTFVWRGDAQTAEELVEKLPFRNHTVEAYNEAFGNLVGRGWIEKTTNGYQVTDKGRALREQVEEATDRHFFAPWACLSGDEKVQMHTLLTQLRNNLQEMAENNEDAG